MGLLLYYQDSGKTLKDSKTFFLHRLKCDSIGAYIDDLTIMVQIINPTQCLYLDSLFLSADYDASSPIVRQYNTIIGQCPCNVVLEVCIQAERLITGI